MTALVIARTPAGDPRGTHVLDLTERSNGTSLCDRLVVPVEPETPWKHTGRPVSCSRCSSRAFTRRAREQRE